MVITEVRIKLVEQNAERLMAFCSITFDHCFAVRDLKIIEGARGLFVAMPSRKLTDRCAKCRGKNHLRARFCNGCGCRLDDTRCIKDADGRTRLHADIAHPIHGAGRAMIESTVVKGYYDELERSKQPGYVCRYDMLDAGDFDEMPVAADAIIRSHPAHEMVPQPNRHMGQPTAGYARAKVA
jgi:stage V sporulation protein G